MALIFYLFFVGGRGRGEVKLIIAEKITYTEYKEEFQYLYAIWENDKVKIRMSNCKNRHNPNGPQIAV